MTGKRQQSKRERIGLKMKIEDYLEDEELEEDLWEEDNPDFKFEYAFESITEGNTQFRKVMPIFE